MSDAALTFCSCGHVEDDHDLAVGVDDVEIERSCRSCSCHFIRLDGGEIDLNAALAEYAQHCTISSFDLSWPSDDLRSALDERDAEQLRRGCAQLDAVLDALEEPEP